MSHQSIRVLLVEDNPTDVLLLQEALAQPTPTQFTVINVERLAEGLERLSQEPFEVVLLDLSLPDSHGLETLVKIRQQTARVPIIVLTGLTDEAFGLKALQEGAQDYLVKGQVESHGLVRAIRYAIERKRAEEALRESEAFNRTVLNSLTSHIAVLDQEGNITSVNQAWERFAHANGDPTLAHTSVGVNYLEICRRATGEFALEASQALAGIEAVLKRDLPEFSMEYSCHSPVEERWFMLHVTSLSVEWGGAVVSHRNITQRKRAEAEIRQRNRELSLLNQIIAASVIELEPEPILEIACRELALAFETPRASAALFNETKTTATVVAEYRILDQPSALGMTFPVRGNIPLQHILRNEGPLLIDSAQDDPRLGLIHDLSHQNEIASLLILPLRISGEVIGVLSLETFEPRSFPASEVSLAWSVADQVAGALARARLIQTQQRLSAAIEQAAESVIITDTAGLITYVNPAFERNSGYSRAEVIGQTPRILKSGQHNAAFYRELWATISAGQVWRGRFVNKKSDNTLYTEDTTITPVRNESGTVASYVSVQHDVTRELQLEEQYRQAQKMEAIGRLSGGVAHDFNNLLVVITGYSEMLLMDRYQHDRDLLRKYVEEIVQAGERAAGLTRQLLAFSRQQVLQPQVLNLNDVVSNLEKMLRRLIGEDINLVSIPGKYLGQVKADPGQIEQVILNLAVNARDAMPNGGKLIIETSNVELDEVYAQKYIDVTAGRYVLLTVSDSGTGMDADVQSHIFEPFFTTKEQGKGTGLGLATVYGIVKQSGGDIRLYSELDQGTTFKVYLPRVDEAVMRLESRPAISELPTGGETLVLVEDEAGVRALVRQALELSGYTVLEASCGPEALKLCEQLARPIHLLVTDVVMPGGMNGRELAEQLQSSRPGLKVLFISGYTNEAIVHHGVLGSASFFLQKPFTPYLLMQKVREVLDAPAPE